MSKSYVKTLYLCVAVCYAVVTVKTVVPIRIYHNILLGLLLKSVAYT